MVYKIIRIRSDKGPQIWYTKLSGSGQIRVRKFCFKDVCYTLHIYTIQYNRILPFKKTRSVIRCTVSGYYFRYIQIKSQPNSCMIVHFDNIKRGGGGGRLTFAVTLVWLGICNTLHGVYSSVKPKIGDNTIKMSRSI